MTPTQIFRCLWCINRIGVPTWFDSTGKYLSLMDVPESDVSDGICKMCLKTELSKLCHLKSETNQAGATSA